MSCSLTMNRSFSSVRIECSPIVEGLVSSSENEKIPSRNTVATNVNLLLVTAHEAGNVPGDDWNGPGAAHNSSSRARGRQGTGGIRVGRPQRRVTNSKNQSGKGISGTNGDKFGPLLGWKGRTGACGGCKRGRRTARSRQKLSKRMAEVAGKRASVRTNIHEKMPTSSQLEWNEEETTLIQVEGAGNMSSSERSEYDENGQATGDDHDNLIVDDYSGGYSGKSTPLTEGIDYDMGEEKGNYEVEGNDEVDDEDEDEDEDDDKRHREETVEEYFNSESEVERNKFVGGEKIVSLSKGSESSSHYSD